MATFSSFDFDDGFSLDSKGFLLSRSTVSKPDASDEESRGYLTDFQRKLLEKRLQQPDLPQLYSQRIRIMLMADEGKGQAEICQILDCCHATARHWISMARSGYAHTCFEQPMGRPKAVSEAYLRRLKSLVEDGPRQHGYVFRQWTASWLSKHLFQEFEIQISPRHINRLLKEMGLSTRHTSTTGVPSENATFPEKAAHTEDLPGFSSHIKIEDLIAPPPAQSANHTLRIDPLAPLDIESHIYGASINGRAAPLLPVSHTGFWYRYFRGSAASLSWSA